MPERKAARPARSAFLAALLVAAATLGCSLPATRPAPSASTETRDAQVGLPAEEAEASDGVSASSDEGAPADPAATPFDYAQVAGYDGSAALPVNGDVPSFSPDELTLDARAEYAQLDRLGRAGVACVLVGPETLPNAPRGDIGTIEPSGWTQRFYPELISQSNGALYNRSHLIAHSLGGIDDARNLVSGTAQLNQGVMQPLEQTLLGRARAGGHVLYRVTPAFCGDELVARGVLMEAQSIEDRGTGTQLRWCRWCPNAQEGIEIDYATGASARSDAASFAGGATGQVEPTGSVHYVFNSNTGKYHVFGACGGQERIAEANRQDAVLTPQEARERRTVTGDAYEPCANCRAKHPELFP